MGFKLHVWAKQKFGEKMAPNEQPIWKNFAEWFGDSKVLTKGVPRVVYHGSRNPVIRSFADEFQGRGIVSLQDQKYGGFFFTSAKGNAQFYADYRKMPGKLDPENVETYGGHKEGWFYVVMDGKGNGVINDGPYRTEDEAQRQGEHHVATYNMMRQKKRDLFVNPVFLRITNPLLVEHPTNSPPSYIPTAKQAGNDGVIILDYVDGAMRSDIYIVFSSTQVKSANRNNGNFSATNPSIMD